MRIGKWIGSQASAQYAGTSAEVVGKHYFTVFMQTFKLSAE
jgi:hypothetical protein